MSSDHESPVSNDAEGEPAWSAIDRGPRPDLGLDTQSRFIYLFTRR